LVPIVKKIDKIISLISITYDKKLLLKNYIFKNAGVRAHSFGTTPFAKIRDFALF
jgi:hypothetical protein